MSTPLLHIHYENDELKFQVITDEIFGLGRANSREKLESIYYYPKGYNYINRDNLSDVAPNEYEKYDKLLLTGDVEKLLSLNLNFEKVSYLYIDSMEYFIDENVFNYINQLGQIEELFIHSNVTFDPYQINNMKIRYILLFISTKTEEDYGDLLLGSIAPEVLLISGFKFESSNDAFNNIGRSTIKGLVTDNCKIGRINIDCDNDFTSLSTLGIINSTVLEWNIISNNEININLWGSEIKNFHYETLLELKKLKNLNLRGFKNMKDFDISRLKKCKYLTKLNVKNCEIERLSRRIGNLKSLTYLDISRNEKITTLPKSIGDLNKLKTLKLKYCSIEKLKDDFFLLDKLETLVISHNYLKEISDNFSKLSSLITLILDDNEIKDMNKRVSLNNLDKITLSSNYISEIITDYNSKNNIYLDLSNNEITNIKYIDKFNIRFLDLNDNKINNINNLNVGDRIKDLLLLDNPLKELDISGGDIEYMEINKGVNVSERTSGYVTRIYED